MKLSLIDQAKCNSSIAYALNSLLFAYLKSVGQDTKDHAIMQELSRVKSYMGKIKSAENKSQGPATVIDKEAASRVVKHALSGNSKIDAKNLEKTRQQDNANKFLQSMAERSLPGVGTHKRFSDDEDDGKGEGAKGNVKDRKKRKTAVK
ncbi:C1D-domain-containing protein [Nadsonia fulvescens var. elongata DSM 6958]|uniref:Exosome complex protein n=1 Tax=Nadsonia fulvescens var. elongata DSM 6958 TaxID=857566 RepID=A0A1E3PTC6_9ASCO|nr:C1D-domain-containing protein [Nadsonia fulvescens var. elongata DSM 6958]